MTDAQMVAAYRAGEKVDYLGVPLPALYAALDRAGVPRRRPRGEHQRPAWWAEIADMRQQGLRWTSISKCFGVTDEAVRYAAKAMGLR